jgi:DNA invertase Pin-like site-specific DNA recombinase
LGGKADRPNLVIAYGATTLPPLMCHSGRMKCKVIGYYRVSTREQGEARNGLDGQQKAVNDYVVSAGCTLLASYTEIEAATKRRTDNRPQLELAMAHAKRAKATLVIGKIDRLSRNVAVLSGLMETGVRFIACDMPTADHFQVHIMVALAQKEAEMTSQRTKEGMAALKARGYFSIKHQRVVDMGKNNFTAEQLAAGRAVGVAAIRRNRAEAYAFVTPILTDMRAAGACFAAIV